MGSDDEGVLRPLAVRPGLEGNDEVPASLEPLEPTFLLQVPKPERGVRIVVPVRVGVLDGEDVLAFAGQPG